jgi:predicted anti-sigma-YlaC factor YlaD
MWCRDARTWLQAQYEGKEDSTEARAVEQHLHSCASCRDFDRKQRRMRGVAGYTDENRSQTASDATTGISTERIMQAVQQHKQISDQVAVMREQQKVRDAHFSKIGFAGIALSILLVSSVPLFFLIVVVVQTSVADRALDFLNGIIDIVVVVGQYMQAGLTQVTHNNMLFTAVACVVVVMIVMWFRLMRLPKRV